MDKEALLRWIAAFNRDNATANSDERRYGKAFRERGYLTKTDLQFLIEWKQGDTAPYLAGNLRHLESFDAKNIEDVTRRCFGERLLSDYELVGKLTDGLQGSGAGLKTVTAILAFWNPKLFGVYDFHAWAGLQADGLVKGDHKETIAEYVDEFLPALRKKASEVDLDVREVEKGYFQFDLDGGGS